MNKILFILGLAMLLIPVGLRVLEETKQEESIATYAESMKNVDEKDIARQLEKAEQYNQMLYVTGSVNLEDYEEQLNLLENGIMGSIDIPKINLKLPVYHGTSEEVLAVGVGHLKESSIPIGGENTHSVLTGHRGAPNAQLFTRLDELEKEDLFFLNVGQETLCYRVCKIQTVTPEDTKAVAIQEGRDLVSLVTCTPYGLNTHRLIVTGERQLEETEISQKVKGDKFSKWDKGFLAISCLSGIAMFFQKKKRKGVRR